MVLKQKIASFSVKIEATSRDNVLKSGYKHHLGLIFPDSVEGVGRYGIYEYNFAKIEKSIISHTLTVHIRCSSKSTRAT